MRILWLPDWVMAMRDIPVAVAAAEAVADAEAEAAAAAAAVAEADALDPAEAVACTCQYNHFYKHCVTCNCSVACCHLYCGADPAAFRQQTRAQPAHQVAQM